MQTLGPTWTAASYDKCLLLALAYPLATMAAIWAMFRQVGVAERALLLPEAGTADRWLWGIAVAALVIVEASALLWSMRTPSLKTFIFWVVVTGVSAWAGAIAATAAGFDVDFVGLVGGVASAGAMVGAFALAVMGAFAGTVALVGSFFVTALVVSVNTAAGATALGPTVYAGCFVAIVAIQMLGEYSSGRGRPGLFLGVLSLVLLLVCFAGVWCFAPLPTWSRDGPLLVIFGLLTLINAPFDWAAIGLTRFLLRRGLAWGGPWPYALAILDAVAAAISVALLAFVAVVAVQTFGDIGILRAGEAGHVVPLGPLFEKLESHPADVENWWIWLMLFSTAVPSVVNLAIASFAFLRGVPFVTKWMLSLMPKDAAMRPRDCLRVSAALAAQVAIGMLLTAMLLYLLFDNVIPFALPWLGGVIRDFSEQIAAYNAPAHVMKWLAGYAW